MLAICLAAAWAGPALRAWIAPEGAVDVDLTTRFFLDQDLRPLLVVTILLFIVSRSPLPRWRVLETARIAPVRHVLPLGLGLGAIAASAWGTFRPFGGFHLSRDEVMADFDATIFASGALVAPIPEIWQPFRSALNTMFVLPVAEPFWMSSYLPGNAALRAAVAVVLDPGWTSPILLGVALLCLAIVSRRLWPGRYGPQLVAIVLLATSPQALVTAATSYAMTAHLALNLLWLSLFLRDDRRGHAGAILVGWLATGLHQSIFHPIFVAPFVLGLFWQHRGPLAARYVLAYVLIFVFWVLYPRILLGSHGLTGESGADLGLAYFLQKVGWMLSGFSLVSVDLMLKNLLRAAAWQNIALLVLVPLSLAAVRRGDGIARQLAAGIALTVGAMFVLLAYQGHGWGYRYIHGLLGNLALLASYGWIAVRSAERDGCGRGRTAFAAATGITALVILPWQVHHATEFADPYRAAVTEILNKPSEVVLIDGRGLQFGADLIRNDPLLRASPKLLDAALLSGEQIENLCRRYTVDAFDSADGRRLGIAGDGGDRAASADALPPIRERMQAIGCRRGEVKDPASG